MPNLQGKKVLVTGASRGLGRATALEFALAGAYVICTARSTRGHSTQANLANLTLDETLEAIQRAGGKGEAYACDQTDPIQVERLMLHIKERYGRLDVLVNNAWGGSDTQVEPDQGEAVWEEPLGQLRQMLLAGAYSDYITSLLALRYLMRAAKCGLILTTTYHNDEPPGWLPYEVSKAAKNRLVYTLGHHLREQGIPVIAVSPGWMRTELMLLHNSPEQLAGKTETPHYAARALVALAADPNALRHTGQVLDVGDLADLYHFTDLDGSQPHWHRDHLAKLESK